MTLVNTTKETPKTELEKRLKYKYSKNLKKSYIAKSHEVRRANVKNITELVNSTTLKK